MALSFERPSDIIALSDEEAALVTAANVMKAFVPESWRDSRMDVWLEQCRALDAAREAGR